MLETTPNTKPDKLKNSYLSIGLIFLNMVLAYVLITTITDKGGDAEILMFLEMLAATILLIGIFAFGYHGKGYNWAKWIFGLILAVGIGCIVLFLMVFG